MLQKRRKFASEGDQDHQPPSQELTTRRGGVSEGGDKEGGGSRGTVGCEAEDYDCEHTLRDANGESQGGEERR